MLLAIIELVKFDSFEFAYFKNRSEKQYCASKKEKVDSTKTVLRRVQFHFFEWHIIKIDTSGVSIIQHCNTHIQRGPQYDTYPSTRKYTVQIWILFD